MKKYSEEIQLASGKTVTKFGMENEQGMRVEILSLGATLIKVMVPDQEGNLENVILSWQDINGYESYPGHFGNVVGRVAGRIFNGEVTLKGHTYHLCKKSSNHTLHGGINGFDTKNWEGVFEETIEGLSLRMNYLSPDNEEGFPGNLKVSVIYTLATNNSLTIRYEAVTDQETVVNLTNHAYFNLSGDAKREIYDQEVYIDSDSIYELDDALIPTGKILTVENEPYFDFRKSKKIGQDIDKENIQLKNGAGYDHIWRLNQGKEAISLYDCISKRCMTITTSEPCVVMYTMNHAEAPLVLENGKVQKPRFGVCFETQKAAIGYNEVNKEDIILKPGDIYKQQTTFCFSIQ